jgi:GNAT superfamily N-acetyltransferase
MTACEIAKAQKVFTRKTLNMDEIQIIEADFENESHRAAIPFLLNEYAKDLLGLRQALDQTVLERLVPEMQKVSNAIVLLAKETTEYIGMAICFLGFSTFEARPLVNIHDFMVLKTHRKRGIGRLLLVEIETVAIRSKCCKITLEVQENNTHARSLYRSMGFKESFLNREAGSQLFLTKSL